MKIRYQAGLTALAFLLLNSQTLAASATQWPVFSSPDVESLVANHYIDTKHCPAGQGKINGGTVIEVGKLCGTYCPSAWVWQVNSDGTCHDLATGFAFQGYDIIHHPDDESHDQDGNTLYSVVTAQYGEADSEQPAFELVFTAPKEHWYCMRLDQNTRAVTCANDI